MKQPSSYLKMRVLGAIDMAEGKTSIERIKRVSEMTFVDEEGLPRQFTWRTIQTWLYRYKNHGVTSMEPGPRRDKGSPRKITPEELLEAINSALPYFRGLRVNKSEIYKYCIEKGILQRNRISPTSFYRFIRQYDLLDPVRPEDKKRLAFAMQYANELWQADTMYGPYVQGDKGKVPTYLIAFIDDASRVLCHGEFYLSDSSDSLMKAIRTAFYKRGVPQQLYVDNGSNYSGAEITLVCARVGTILRHTPVRDGSAKGKIERFFRRVRDQFLVRKLDISSLTALNRQFTDWVEDEYNAKPHSAIGMPPIDRFGLDLSRINFLPPSDVNDELFFAETKRKVKKDNTFSFKNLRYETPVDLRGKEVTIRYDRTTCSRLILFYREQRMGEAKPLDLIANGQLRRGDQS